MLLFYSKRPVNQDENQEDEILSGTPSKTVHQVEISVHKNW